MNNAFRMFYPNLYSVSIYTILAGMLIFMSCSSENGSSEPESDGYGQAVSDFYMSLGASQTDESRFAFNKMNDVAMAFPEEAAAWANLAVYAMRQGNFELAIDRIETATELEPQNTEILFLAGLVESRRGNSSEAIDYMKRGLNENPDHLKLMFALIQELERQNDTENADEIVELLSNLNNRVSENQLVLFERARFSVKIEDFENAQNYIEKLYQTSESWTTEQQQQFDTVFELITQKDMTGVSLELSFLRSTIEPTPRFQTDALEVRFPPTDVGFLITEFLHLPIPEVVAAEPDFELTLTHTNFNFSDTTASWLKGVTLLEDLPPFPVYISDGNVIIDSNTKLAFPGDTDDQLSIKSVTEIDYNYDFINDLAFAGSQGFRLHRLNEDQSFTDVTTDLQIQSETINGSYNGVWAFDMEMDGDLDLFLARTSGEPIVLRNNGDGTFSEQSIFSSSNTTHNFLWVDLTSDGVPEAALLSGSGAVSVYENMRAGNFSQPIQLIENVTAMNVGDTNADGRFDIVALNKNGEVYRHYYSINSGEWVSHLLFETNRIDLETGQTNLFIADMDNNGSLDILISGNERTELWLSDANHEYSKHEFSMDNVLITDVFDVEGNERLDLLGISTEGEPFYLENEGTKNYFARSIRARASGTDGDQRINSFGIGGEMEIRSGLLYQKQLISSPIVHFGLGEYEEAQMLRIIWPNGSVQAEFAELGIGATIFNEQILKGSCPWLFTNDGEDIHFITDALWRSPLGLRINAQETAGVIQTFDRVKIPEDKLKPIDGLYDIRITAELWETHFFDYVNVVAVDYPEDTEIFVDERFVFPAPDLSTQVVNTPVSVAKVIDQNGNNLTETVSEMDQNYIQPFQKTAYQGLAEEHYIEIELSDANETSADMLILSGWLHPTDSSINLALSQGVIDPPQGLRVDISDGENGWINLHENYGFPAGKLKTILLDLEGVFSHAKDRKVRLTTTSEIYWDGIFQAGKRDGSEITETRLTPTIQELRYRGFSDWYKQDDVSPILPDYSEIAGTNQMWRDLEGYHTRFGDISELVTDIDDRYVIMNAGDELLFKFQALSEPKEGYKRSFIFESDGWVKDGDYNTEASATVLPLPFHGQSDYEYKARGTLSDDPIYQKYAEDWVHYHTRYVTSHPFRTTFLFDEK